LFNFLCLINLFLFQIVDSFQRRPNIVQRTAPAEDLSKLHPSWQAKKLMEDKLKNMKFEGKKLKFDD